MTLRRRQDVADADWVDDAGHVWRQDSGGWRQFDRSRSAEEAWARFRWAVLEAVEKAAVDQRDVYMAGFSASLTEVAKFVAEANGAEQLAARIIDYLDARHQEVLLASEEIANRNGASLDDEDRLKEQEQ